MPTPPRKNEKKDNFTNRCMKELVGKEGKKQNQVAAICNSMWRDKDKK